MPAVQQHLSLKNILFTTDFSEFSDHALPFAVGLAQCYSATIFVGHAIPPEPRRPIPLDWLPPELDEGRYHAQSAMNHFLRTAPLAGVHYQAVLAKGNPQGGFCGYGARERY